MSLIGLSLNGVYRANTHANGATDAFMGDGIGHLEYLNFSTILYGFSGFVKSSRSRLASLDEGGV